MAETAQTTTRNWETLLPELKESCVGLRRDILEMITTAGSGHPGGSLSAIDLIASLYASHLVHNPMNPSDPQRDFFVLSKGHGVPALYTVLAKHGYIARSQLNTLRQLGSPLQGHPVVGTVPGIEACTGSLGQGLSVAVGMALGQRLNIAKGGRKDARTFCLMGDGEIQEGQVWEALMSASKFKLDNLVAIVDFNKAQIDGLVKDVMPLEPIEDKARSFGWLSRRIDGHDYRAILEAYDWGCHPEGAPKIIIADTIKGKGVSFMESELVKWHGVAPTQEQLEKALAELVLGKN